MDLSQRNRLCVITLMIILLGGCAGFFSKKWPSEQAREYQPEQAALDYISKVQPILERRCVVCHGCYDAPCQLKLDSYQGLLRGANKEKVYDGTRLLGTSLTRMFEDAQTTAEWREKFFFPVLNEGGQPPEQSLFVKMLELKQAHPLPNSAFLPETFNLDINRDMSCPTPDQFAAYETQTPLWGMPYGLPGLSRQEHQTLMDWLDQGAKHGLEKKLSPQTQRDIARWETFLNGDSLKQQLVNRYIYEHLFLANLLLPSEPDSHFKLVRSRTPPGEPIERIATRRPFDDPQVERVYYRLWRDPSSRLAKNFLPYKLDDARLARWQSLFYNTDYQVEQWPGYAPDVAANPFVSFAQLPVGSRYRFMLDEAQFTIMNFIKGPVCRGQVALNVIQDHFWVFFISPELTTGAEDGRFLAENSKHLAMPAELGNPILPLSSWLKYSSLQKEYLAAKGRFVQEKVDRQGAVSLDFIWDGSGHNPNAALTVFRHNDSASVVKGMVGDHPKTAWIIGYPLMERIHYLLVAGFDVYGNVSHQLLSRLYMDFLRMEGEMTFIDLLPPEMRHSELTHWYKDAEKDVLEYLKVYEANLNLKNAIPYISEDPKAELYEMLRARLNPVLDQQHNLRRLVVDKSTLENLQQLDQTRGASLRWLPQTTLIYIPEVGLFTLLHNGAFSNLSSLFREEARRVPEEDTVTLGRGIIGAYPNAIMLVSEAQLPDFVARIQSLASEDDYTQLRNRYGIRRTDADFWHYSDLLHDYYQVAQPEDAGLLDYNRLENR
jgi:hypothetical protein